MTRTALTVGLASLAVLVASSAWAEVSVNSGALDQLRPEKPRASTHGRRQAAPKPPSAPAHPAPEPPVPPQAAAPRVPAAPPNPAALPPPAVAVPTAPAPPAPAIPVKDDAPGGAEPIDGGLRVTFGKDSSDLNPAAVSAIQQLAAQAKDKGGPLDLNAFAAGSPDDPSTPRRLSLARALAVRAVLLHEGIASPRIYVKAQGAGSGPGEASPDRVDLVQEHPAAGNTQAAGR